MGRGPTPAGSQEEGAFTHGLFQARGRHCRHCLRTLSWEHLNPGEAVRPEGHYLALGCHRVAVPAPQVRLQTRQEAGYKHRPGSHSGPARELCSGLEPLGGRDSVQDKRGQAADVTAQEVEPASGLRSAS